MKISLPIINKINFQKPKIQSFSSSEIKFKKGLEKDTFEYNKTIDLKNSNEVEEIPEEEFIDPIDKFDTSYVANKLHNAIIQQLKITTPEEIETYIQKIKEATGASDEVIKEVLVKLAQFSSYKALPEIKHQLEKLGIETIYKNDELDLNKAMYYLGVKKEQLFDDDVSLFSQSKAYFVDENFLKDLEKLKKTEPSDFKRLKNYFTIGRLTLIAPQGWLIKKNGKLETQGIFNLQENIVENAILTIQKMQNENLSINEALDNDLIKRIDKLFDEEVEVCILKNSQIKENSIDEICNLLAPKIPTKKELEACIKAYLQIYLAGDENIIGTEEIISKYFENQLCCYDAKTLSLELRKKYKGILKEAQKRGIPEDKIYYHDFNSDKSFNLIAYQYFTVNNIPFDKLDSSNTRPEDNSMLILLDDMIGTGSSLLTDEFNYNIYIQYHKGQNIIFSPIVGMENGCRAIYNAIEKRERLDKDGVLPNKVIDFEKFKNSLSEEEQKKLTNILGLFSYKADVGAIAFPYMLPDNNTAISSIALTNFLSTITPESNKGFSNPYGDFFVRPKFLNVILSTIKNNLKEE